MVIRKVIVDSFGTLMSPKPPGVVGQYVSLPTLKHTLVHTLDFIRGIVLLTRGVAPVLRRGWRLRKGCMSIRLSSGAHLHKVSARSSPPNQHPIRRIH